MTVTLCFISLRYLPVCALSLVFPTGADFGGREDTQVGLRMLSKTRFVAGCLVLLVAVLAGPTHAQSNEKAAQASRFIEGLADEAVSALTAPNVSPEEREQRFKDLLNENFAVTTIGQWVLGRYWAKATVEERREYLRLFEDMIIITYLNRFKRYSGESLSVTRSLVDDQSGDVMVFSQIKRPAGSQPLDVAWRVRPKGNSFKIVDVMVEGVSMSQTQRKEYASVIRRNGGQVEGLLAEMRQKVKG